MNNIKIFSPATTVGLCFSACDQECYQSCLQQYFDFWQNLEERCRALCYCDYRASGKSSIKTIFGRNQSTLIHTKNTIVRNSFYPDLPQVRQGGLRAGGQVYRGLLWLPALSYQVSSHLDASDSHISLHCRAVAEALSSERGRLPAGSEKHLAWAGGLELHTKPWVRARAGRDYWEKMRPAGGGGLSLRLCHVLITGTEGTERELGNSHT